MKKQNPVNAMVKVLISDISTGRSADLKHELLHSFKFINMQTHEDTNTNDSHLDTFYCTSTPLIAIIPFTDTTRKSGPVAISHKWRTFRRKRVSGYPF